MTQLIDGRNLNTTLKDFLMDTILCILGALVIGISTFLLRKINVVRKDIRDSFNNTR